MQRADRCEVPAPRRETMTGGSGALAGGLRRSPLRVLIVIDSLGLGGAESLLLPYVRAAPSAAIQVDVVSVAGPSDERRQMVPLLDALGVRPHFLDSHRLLAPGAVPRLVRIMMKTRCDIVHAHLENAITLAAVAGWVVGRPTICTFHHNPFDMPWRDTARERLAVLASSVCARTIFVSDASMAGWERRHRRRANWTVVRNGVDLGQFAMPPFPPSLPEELGIPPQVPVALLAASMRGRKGHGTAIAAWPDVLSKVPDARLLLVGSGDQEAFLRSEVSALGLGASVVFAGFRSDMPRLVQGSTLVLLPSESEALPTVLLEAGAAGRCVIASTAGGIPEVVQDGETGLLVDPGDAEGLAAAVTALLTDAERRRQMGEAARLWVSERFGAEKWVARLRDLYDEALNTR